MVIGLFECRTSGLKVVHEYEVSSIAVSYTHLDVYKRQGIG